MCLHSFPVSSHMPRKINGKGRFTKNKTSRARLVQLANHHEFQLAWKSPIQKLRIDLQNHESERLTRDQNIQRILLNKLDLKNRRVRNSSAYYNQTCLVPLGPRKVVISFSPLVPLLGQSAGKKGLIFKIFLTFLVVLKERCNLKFLFDYNFKFAKFFN